MIVGVRHAPADRLCLPPGLEMAGGGRVNLRFGAAGARVPWVQGDDPWLSLPRPLARRLGVPLPSRLRLSWLPLRRTLRLGPAVGILVRKAPSRFGPFGPQAAFIRELMEAATSLGIFLYAFSPADVRWARRRIKGYRYGEHGVWRTGPCPYPDVLWDRGFFSGAAHRRYWHTRGRLLAARPGMKIVNAIFGNKWRVHRLLRRHPEVSQHLPHTLWCRGPAGIVSMVRRHGTAYLKPVAGAKGRGIMRVQRLASGRFRFQTASRTCFGSLRAVAARAWKRAGRRYLVQQGIDLASPFGQPGDLRLVVQKDGRGTWQVTGGAMRVAAAGRITSNLHRGGHAVALEDAVRRMVGEGRYGSALAAANRLALDVARIVEAAAGPSGEMGIDLAMDRSGRIWFLETNSKLARTVFLQLGQTEVRRKSIVRPLIWAARQAGFAQSGDVLEGDGI
ncbi:MAG TPA: YheC/YheD family protein [Bacillota bacterium]|nr:YheC/YheD family protein [Bacillota bacterium]